VLTLESERRRRMKASLMTAALAVALWGGTAVADDWSTSQSTDVTSEEALEGSELQSDPYAPPATTTPQSSDQRRPAASDISSPTVDPYAPSEQREFPVESEEERRTSMEQEQQEALPPAEGQDTIIVPAPAAATTPALEEDEKRETADTRGLTVMLGGGVEGYTGDFAPGINPGPAWGVTAALKPSKVLGIELGYSGAVNEIDNVGAGEGVANGADIIRNGGHAALTLGLTSTGFQPYLMGGIGINKYDVRGAGTSAGYSSDVSGSVPLGGGVRTHIGNFTADARFGYNVLFDNDLAAVQGTELAGQDTTLGAGGRYTGVLSIGTTF